MKGLCIRFESQQRTGPAMSPVPDTSTITLSNTGIPLSQRKKEVSSINRSGTSYLWKRLLTELQESDFFICVSGESRLWTQIHRNVYWQNEHLVYFANKCILKSPSFTAPPTLDWKSYSSMPRGIRHSHCEIKCSSNSKRKDRVPKLSWRKCF